MTYLQMPVGWMVRHVLLFILFFELILITAEWHTLAKMRLHTDSTLAWLDESTKAFRKQIDRFIFNSAGMNNLNFFLKIIGSDWFESEGIIAVTQT
jgi:hypothetical protein